MKTKIVVVFVIAMLIITVFPITISTTDDTLNIMFNNDQPSLGMISNISYVLSPRIFSSNEGKIYYKLSMDAGWYWMQSYPNYAPHLPGGMPDFSQKQNEWKTIYDGGNGIAESIASGDDIQVAPQGTTVPPNTPVIASGPNCFLESTSRGDDHAEYTYCAATSLANSFWWFDSKFADPDGFPGDGKDTFPLVEDYGAGDDHIIDNVPCLICILANEMNITTQGQPQVEDYIGYLEKWFSNTGLEDKFEFYLYWYPTFEFVTNEINQGKVVLLFLGFYNQFGNECIGEIAHAVTLAGLNTEELLIAISDPYFDIQNPYSNPIGHNDAVNVSHDIYDVIIGSPCNNLDCEWWLSGYPIDLDYATIDAVAVIFSNNPPEAPIITGPTTGDSGEELEFSFSSLDPEENDIYLWIDWGDDTFEGWIGPYGSDESVRISHVFEEDGIYDLTAKARDILDKESHWSDPFEVMIGNPPDTPTITGETNGKVGVEYEYTFNAVDPDEDNVKYYIDWDDGDPEETGFNPSGDDVKLKNTWNGKGTYTITAYAEDEFGLVGLEGTLTVTITKGKNWVINSPFQWFLQQHPNLFPILRKVLLLQR